MESQMGGDIGGGDEVGVGVAAGVGDHLAQALGGELVGR